MRAISIRWPVLDVCGATLRIVRSTATTSIPSLAPVFGNVPRGSGQRSARVSSSSFASIAAWAKLSIASATSWLGPGSASTFRSRKVLIASQCASGASLSSRSSSSDACSSNSDLSNVVALGVPRDQRGEGAQFVGQDGEVEFFCHGSAIMHHRLSRCSRLSLSDRIAGP